PKKLDEIELQADERFYSKIQELDRVVGGGLVSGSLVLLGGDPGIGKSTLTLQIGKANPELEILYCAGEESDGQIKQRAKRLGVSSGNFYVYTDTDISKILSEARKMEPDLLIVEDRKSTRLNSSHVSISYAVFCLKKK